MEPGFVQLAGRCAKASVGALAVLCLLLFSKASDALVLTSYFETVLVRNVSTSWTTVSLDNSYANAIPVCTYVLGTFAGTNPNYTNVPAVTRIKSITSNSFDLRIQGWEDSSATTADVHCIVVDEGAHTLPDGRDLEAHSVDSDQTSGQFSTDGGWDLDIPENVSGSIVHNYTNPVVLGQVISHNDNRASVIYMNDCSNRGRYPFQTTNQICVGKHIGMIPGSRATEKIGYILAEQGSGTVNNVFYELALGADAVGGNNNANVGDSYGVAADHTMAVLTQSAEDGGNGSWAVLYGSDPLPSGSIELVVDEEIFAGDTTRNHTTENVYYWAFTGGEITLVKNLINDDSGTASLNDFVLSATGPSSISGISGDIAVTKAPLQPGIYTLSETTVPGYTASAWSCTGATSFVGDKVEVLAGDHAICTITNDDESNATLTLQKTVVNDGAGDGVAGDFELSFTGATSSGTGFVGDAAITSVVVPAGSYTLSEVPVNGYQLTSITCDGSDANGLDGLTLVAGEDITCMFVNDDLSVDLDVDKKVSNASPDIGEKITFTLIVSNAGPDAASSVQVVDPVPAGFSYVPSSIGGGDAVNAASPASPGLNWTINSLPAGASTSLTFDAIVLAP